MLILRQGVAAGEEELRQHAMLVYSAADPAFICDAKGRLKLANPAMAALTGAALEDLAGRNLAAFMDCPDHPGDPTEACQFWEIYPARLAEGWSGEAGIRQESGHTVPVHLSLSPFSAPGARQVWLAGTAHDLTQQKIQQADLQMAYDQVAAAHRALEALNENLERKVDEKMHSLSQAYAQLEQQNRTLQQLDRLKSDFVSLVSHELRAPLTNISGGIELVLTGPLDDSLRQPLSLVQSEIHRLTTFVETILDVSALDAGHLPLYLAPVSIAEAVKVVHRRVGRQPGGERVVWEVPPGLPLVMADERILTSIFFHLVDNALKYAPQGAIRVAAKAAGECLQVTVEDEGPGIPAEALPLLFEKFQRLEAADSQTVYGHGLGLYMVRKLLHAMHGDVQASNREGHHGEDAPVTGACFTFWLPVYQDGEK
jgi:PAS domain S-box-containing protein